ncbi:unnamed protein product [Rotaria sp. Silwood1]|nr:unnamed protein product [Rotaria sp. Silwood1]CAF5121713.1 unnamed protein product [Rotaria sp. Silwood1]
MDKKSSEKDLIENDDQSKSLITKIYLTIRSNWIPLLFALIICIMTIIVVPIIYTFEKQTSYNNGTNLAWEIKATTFIDQQMFIDKANLTLGNISGLSFDGDYNLYIVDKTKHRIVSLTDDITIIVGHPNGTNGNDSTSLNFPNDIYIDKSNNIYIADTNNHRIQVWNKESKQVTTIFGTDGKGTGTNQLDSPMSVTMDDNSCIYIADYGNNRIISFNISNNQANKYLEKTNNLERHQYVETPISIKFDSVTKTIVIAQEKGYNVIRWNINSEYWTLIAGSASSDLTGISRTLFNKLCYVYVDKYAHIYVADCINQRIQFFTYSATELVKGRTIAGVISAVGNNSYIFNHPTAITLDQYGNLFVADSLNYRIQKFKQTSILPTN